MVAPNRTVNLEMAGGEDLFAAIVAIVATDQIAKCIQDNRPAPSPSRYRAIKTSLDCDEGAEGGIAKAFGHPQRPQLRFGVHLNRRQTIPRAVTKAKASTVDMIAQ